MEAKGKATKAALNHPHTIIDSAKPDIILGSESWLTPDIKNSEIFPGSFDAVRKDRESDAHGGVLLLSSVTRSVLKLRNWTPTVK